MKSVFLGFFIRYIDSLEFTHKISRNHLLKKQSTQFNQTITDFQVLLNHIRTELVNYTEFTNIDNEVQYNDKVTAILNFINQPDTGKVTVKFRLIDDEKTNKLDLIVYVTNGKISRNKFKQTFALQKTISGV